MYLDMIDTDVMTERHKDFLREADHYRLAKIAQSANGGPAQERAVVGWFAAFIQWMNRGMHISNRNSRLPRGQAHS